MSELIIGAIMAVLIGLTLAVIVGWGKFVQWHVKNNRAAVMSRADEGASQNTLSSLQTRHQTGADQTEDPQARRSKLLDTYRTLRKLGMSRDDARALLKPWGIPLDNNLWTQAAPTPPEEPMEVTPIAGRPTSAQFSDPELAYHPPPR